MPTGEAGEHLTGEARQRVLFTAITLFNIFLLITLLLFDSPQDFPLRHQMHVLGLGFCLLGYVLAQSGYFHMHMSRGLYGYLFALSLVAAYGGEDPQSLVYLLLVPPLACYLLGEKEGLIWSVVFLVLAMPLVLQGSPRYLLLPYVCLTGLSLLIEHYRALAQKNSETWREQNKLERQQLLEAQAELKSSESRFKAFSELASDWLFELDKDLTYTYATPRGLEILAAPPDIKLSELRTDMRERDVVADMLQGKEIRNEQVSFLDYNGELVYVLFSARPLYDAAGAFTGYIGAGTNITEIKQAEEALRKKDQELQHIQKLEALGRLTSGVAHDFNNLLAVIGGSLEMLEGQHTAQDQAKIEASLRAVNRAAELTQQLLSFARKQDLKPQNVQVADVFNNLTQMCSRTLEASIKVDTSIEAGTWDCYADVGQLENALLNLVLNARDAMSGRGVIQLTAHNVEITAPEGELIPGDYVEIAVHDTGHGIAHDDLRRITEPFFTTKPVGKGTGLGLSMVYGFAQQSGGLLKTRSSMGEGSTFSILLPRSEVAADQDADQDSGQSLLQGNVLLIDDDPAVLKVLSMSLERMGLTVHGFSSAEGALDALPGIQPRLVITDLMLGEGMNGIQLADAVAAQDANLPVILVSGNPDQLLQGEAFQRHGNNLLGKPFSQQKLANLVREKLGQRPQPSLETRIQSG